MAPTFQHPADMPSDVFLLILDEIIDDATTLCNLGLASQLLRHLTLPYLLRDVDLSSHNNGRLAQHESPPVQPLVYADYDARYTPSSLLPRQRAFLHLMTSRPELAVHVQSFTWTLVWAYPDSSDAMPDIDRKTWEVFGRLTSVTRLDLASLHSEDWEPDAYVRQSPQRLFPAVTDLRLLGWMHRGLPRAIIDSLDLNRLQAVRLHYLEDEGAFPGGRPMNIEVNKENAPHDDGLSHDNIVDTELQQRQDAGSAFIFPGPMWLPLRMLSSATSSLERLETLEIKLSGFAMEIDTRNYYTMFHEAMNLIIKTRRSLKSLVIIVDEPYNLYHPHSSGCGTGRMYWKSIYLPWCLRMSATFLNKFISTLGEHEFPILVNIDIEGFHLLEMASESDAESAGLESTWKYIKESPWVSVDFTGKSHISNRGTCHGYDFPVPNEEEWKPALEWS